METNKGFTLVELLIVIGILAVISTATALILNPVELLNRARDATRISDMDTLDKALTLYRFSGSNFGDADTVYISLPDTSTSCANHTLPPLPPGQSYACVTESNLRNVDGTGWVPVNFTSTSAGSPIAKLPIDPVNSDTNQLYYSYITGSWELTANTESVKYLRLASGDGGDSLSYEVGSNLKLNPIRKTSFDMDAFPTTTSSNQPAWKSISGTGSVSLSSDSEGDYLRVSGGMRWYEYQENIPFNPNSKYKISCRVRQISDPTSGGKWIYCGVSGVAADGITRINVKGENNAGNQHYFAASANSLTAGSGYTTFSGYFKGNGTPAGGKKPDPNLPGKMYPGVAYIRPLFILNYNGGDGIADIEFEILEVIE